MTRARQHRSNQHVWIVLWALACFLVYMAQLGRAVWREHGWHVRAVMTQVAR